MIFLDLYYFDQGADDLPTGVEVGVVQPRANLCRELIQLAEHQPQFRLVGRAIAFRSGNLLEPIEPSSGVLQVRLELVLVQ